MTDTRQVKAGKPDPLTNRLLPIHVLTSSLAADHSPGRETSARTLAVGRRWPGGLHPPACRLGGVGHRLHEAPAHRGDEPSPGAGLPEREIVAQLVVADRLIRKEQREQHVI